MLPGLAFFWLCFRSQLDSQNDATPKCIMHHRVVTFLGTLRENPFEMKFMQAGFKGKTFKQKILALARKLPAELGVLKFKLQ